MAKILMVQTQSIPYTAVAYVNGAVKSAGHDFQLQMALDNEAGPVLEKIEECKPDLIGFSSMTGFHSDHLAISKEIKKKYDTPIIMGGSHPTLFPDVIHEPEIDIICKGEGEYAIIDLMNALEEKKPYDKIENLWVKEGENGQLYENPVRPYADPMDDIPMIDWDCFIDTPVESSSVVAFPIRGCPYKCSYCFNDSIMNLYKKEGGGKYVRAFSPERAVQEIEQGLKVMKNDSVLFLSDVFGVDTDWMEDFLSLYVKKINLPYIVLLRPELAKPKVVELLGKYNCTTIGMGVESGSERVRKEVLKRSYSNKMLIEAAKRIHSYGITLRTYNIIGLPGESEDELWETINLNTKMKVEYPRTGIFMPFPGTTIVDYSKENGFLGEDFSFENMPNSILSASILKGVDKDKVRNHLYFFQSMINYPRLQKFFNYLINNFKPNILFRFYFYLIYANIQRKSESRSIMAYIKFIIPNIGKV